MFVFFGICFGIFLAICRESCPQICHVGKNIKKSHGLLEFASAHLEEVGLAQIPVDHAPLSTTCHIGLHVDFSSMNFLLGL